MLLFRLSFLMLAITTTSVFASDGTTFTYQGDLREDSQPANGTFDMVFTLWDAVSDGNQVGLPQVVSGVQVTDGRFTVPLDFGANAFDNSDRWLEIEVNATPLSPRQPITRTPYAIQTRGIFVDDAGNVGIGTSAPSGKVELVAEAAHDARETILQAGVSDAPGDFLRIDNSTGNNDQFIPMLWGHHQTDDRQAFVTIATADPLQDTGTRPMMDFDVYRWDGTDFVGPIVNRPLFRWANANDPIMTITADGNIGIGTTSPQKALQLDLPSSANEGIFLAKSGTSHGSSMTVSGSNNQIFRINLDPNDVSGYEQFEITYNSTPVFTIDDDGAVGIGTSTPGSQLHIVNDGSNYPLHIYQIIGPMGSALFFVTDNGAVYIKDSIRFADWKLDKDDSSYNLQISNANGIVAEIDGNTGEYIQLSDATLKKNVEPMNNVLTDVTRLEPIRFHLNEQENDTPKYYGFIAQEVQKQFPDLVHTREDGTQGLAYNNFGVLAIKAIQEQQAIIDKQQDEISQLTTRLERLEAMITVGNP